MLRLKAIVATVSARFCAICVVLLCCTPVSASDPDLLLVLDPSGELQAGFVSALRIQLGGAYRIRVRQLALPDKLPERLALATQLVASEQALAAVWVERAELSAHGPSSAVLYVIGRRAGRALLEVVEANGARGLDLERMLSIKLSELLAELQAQPAHPLAPAPALPRLAVQPSVSPSSPAPTLPLSPTAALATPPPYGAEAPRLWGEVYAGPRFDVGLGTAWSRFGGAAWAALERSFGALRGGVGLGLEAYPALSARNARGAQLSMHELIPRALMCVSWSRQSFALSLNTGPQWSFIGVRGLTPLGRSRDDQAGVFGWSFGLGAEHKLWRSLALGASIELQSSAQRLHFDVNGTGVLDRGWLRLTFGLDLRFRAGLSRTTP